MAKMISDFSKFNWGGWSEVESLIIAVDFHLIFEVLNIGISSYKPAETSNDITGSNVVICLNSL